MSCGSVPIRITLYHGRLHGPRQLPLPQTRHIRFRQAGSQLATPIWARTVPVSESRGPTSPRPQRPYATQRTRRLVTQNSNAHGGKRVPRAFKTVSHGAREGPAGIRARTRANAAGRDSVPQRSTTGEHTARTCARPSARQVLSCTARSAQTIVQPKQSAQADHGTAAVDSCSRVASLPIGPRLDSMSAAIFSSMSIFGTTRSASRPACQVRQERRRSDQRDDRDSAAIESRA